LSAVAPVQRFVPTGGDVVLRLTEQGMRALRANAAAAGRGEASEAGGRIEFEVWADRSAAAASGVVPATVAGDTVRLSLAAVLGAVGSASAADGVGGAVYVQARLANEGEEAGGAIGAPIVVLPARSPARYEDGLTARLRRAAASGDGERARQIASLLPRQREELRTTVELVQPAGREVFGAWVFVDERVVLETAAGAIEIELAWDEAPRTAAWFRGLAAEGVYAGTVFHRIAGGVGADDGLNARFVQGGDPTNTGRGGVGRSVGFERTGVGHVRGVVSLARLPTRPNSGSSQFLICVREASELDGRFAAFGRVVRGMDAVDTIAAMPRAMDVVGGGGLADGAGGGLERPIEPVVVEGVRLWPGPALAARPTAETAAAAAAGVESVDGDGVSGDGGGVVR
jgi:cyclophilin family peptidyl-prolyl cis-trans isomerase